MYLVATVLVVSLEVLQYHLGNAYKLPVTTVKINQANLIKCAAIIVHLYLFLKTFLFEHDIRELIMSQVICDSFFIIL